MRSPLLLLMTGILLLSLTSLGQISLQEVRSNHRKLPTISESVYCSSRDTSKYPTSFLLSWDHLIDSTHFSVYYTTSGPDAATHEYAQNVSNAFEYSWETEVTNFGFDAPPDPKIPVYIKDIPPPDIGITYWALGHVLYIEIDNALSSGLANATCAHEFFHAVQVSYDPDESDWIAEGSAVWMESKVYPEHTDPLGSYVSWVNTYMSFPDGALTARDYDAVLFWIFLDEHYGGVNTIENILQQTRSKNGIYAVNATLNTRGTTFTKVFKEWTIANYLKNIYYSKGQLFDSISAMPVAYSGAMIDHSGNVVDWGADYLNITSSVIYMPMQFFGEQSHNLTKILMEHGSPIVSDYLLAAPYSGSFSLMQANNLDRIVIIVRSLGTETSNNRASYSLIFAVSSYTLGGPYYLTSSSFALAVVNDLSSQLSAISSIATIQSTSAQASSLKNITAVSRSSSHISSTSKIAIVSKSTSQTCSTKTTTVVSRSSSQNSSTVGPIRVRMEGDVNGDGVVNNIDLEALSRAYGSTPQAANWNQNCDLNLDNIINALDLQKLGKNYGKSV